MVSKSKTAVVVEKVGLSRNSRIFYLLPLGKSVFYALYKGSGFLSSFLLLRHEKETLAAGSHMRTMAISDRLLDKTSDWLS